MSSQQGVEFVPKLWRGQKIQMLRGVVIKKTESPKTPHGRENTPGEIIRIMFSILLSLALTNFLQGTLGSRVDSSNLNLEGGRWSSREMAPPPISNFDLLRYVGRWFQVYSDLASNTFESKYCVVADYGLFGNGTVSVRNRDRLGNVTGEQNGILGWGGLNNRTGLSTATGALTVNLQIPDSRGPPFPAPYDIILLGPPDYGEFGSYQFVPFFPQ